MRARPQHLAILAVSISLSGCGTRNKENLLPQTGPTMKEVYEAHFARSRQGNDPQARIGAWGPDDAKPDGFAKGASEEIDKRFPRLPNPDLIMYVFPHLSDGNYPVPGYSTQIPMYDRIEYALPGEKEGWQ